MDLLQPEQDTASLCRLTLLESKRLGWHLNWAFDRLDFMLFYLHCASHGRPRMCEGSCGGRGPD